MVDNHPPDLMEFFSGYMYYKLSTVVAGGYVCCARYKATPSWAQGYYCYFIAMATAGDWVDVRDPNVIAETELLQAAASIEAAAKKLAELKPRPKVVCALGLGLGLGESALLVRADW